MLFSCNPQLTCRAGCIDAIRGIADFFEDTGSATIAPIVTRAVLVDVETASLADGIVQSLIGTWTTRDDIDLTVEHTSDNGTKRCENVKLIDNATVVDIVAGNDDGNNEDDRDSCVNTANINDNNGHDDALPQMLAEGIPKHTINESALSAQSDDNNETFGALPANDTFAGGTGTAACSINDSCSIGTNESHSKEKERDSGAIAGEAKMATIEIDTSNDEHDNNDSHSDNHNDNAENEFSLRFIVVFKLLNIIRVLNILFKYNLTTFVVQYYH